MLSIYFPWCSEPGWSGPATLNFLCLVSGSGTSGQVYVSGPGLSSQVLIFFCVVSEPGRSGPGL